jgi:hypothetical protein
LTLASNSVGMRAMPKKAKAKPTPKPRTINKSAFVRGLSEDLSAADVVTAAKKQGFKLSTAQVYTIRANARRASTKKQGPKASLAAGVHTGGSSASNAGSSSNKSAFIRSLPTSMPAGEVVAKAKAAGLTLSAGLVYAVRSNVKSKGGVREVSVGTRGTRAATPSGSLEKQFISLALDLGLSTAEALLGRVRARLKDI